MGIERIEHFLLLSDDIDATRDFYCRALGLSAGERPPLAFPGYWLYADGRALVHIADRGCYSAHAASIGLDVAATGGAVMRIDHIAFAATDYVDAAERLERGGIAVTRNTVPGAGLRQLFFADPDGVRIEVNVFASDASSQTDERE
jgi:catechol 2,3-dioxygenase-like lactoylglutathione lyase family enzyme